VHSGHSGKPGTGIPDNGNQQRNPLTVTPAANPAIAAGTAYAILLSDSLSVDGLAQNIAETLTLYQKYARLRRRDGRVTSLSRLTVWPSRFPARSRWQKRG
jgi:hypothetical protein